MWDHEYYLLPTFYIGTIKNIVTADGFKKKK